MWSVPWDHSSKRAAWEAGHPIAAGLVNAVAVMHEGQGTTLEPKGESLVLPLIVSIGHSKRGWHVVATPRNGSGVGETPPGFSAGGMAPNTTSE